jgi:hypothetical protein
MGEMIMTDVFMSDSSKPGDRGTQKQDQEGDTKWARNHEQKIISLQSGQDNADISYVFQPTSTAIDFKEIVIIFFISSNEKTDTLKGRMHDISIFPVHD